MRELREIREQAEKAAKTMKEIAMMAKDAEDGLWVEVNQAEVGSTSMAEAKDGFTDESRETMKAQIAKTRELFNKAVEELGDSEGKLEDIDDGLKKGLEKGMVELIEKKLADLESAL
ncbi:hypothetical protein IID19_05025 [Patescibacteria group bacterium]|nr:hypothetical protein [Patescibacteria group bacterium]